MADINKILVASDGSEHAIHAASFAGEIGIATFRERVMFGVVGGGV